MVILYALAFGAAEEEKLMPLLPLSEQERLNSLKNQKRKVQSLYAWSLLNCLLRREFGMEKLPEVARGEMGKPYFPQYPALHISLSHTEGAAIAAAADVPVGADVEKLRRVPEHAGKLFGGAQSEEEFWQSWTAAESRLKLRGRGIGAVRQELVPLENEITRQLMLFPGYTAAVSCCGENEMKIVKVSAEELYEYMEKDIV